jgi:hypothetical protein
MKRRAIGLIIALLAVLCAGSAVILGWRAAGQAAHRPLSEPETLTLTATDAAYVSPTSLTEITGASLEVTDTITAVASTDYPSIAIWDVRTSVSDPAGHEQLEPMARTVVFDRKTAELVDCCGGNIDGDALIRQSGIAGWAFPVGTRKQAYSVFDTVLYKPVPVTFSGTEMVDGIPAYRFTEDISAAAAGYSTLSSTDPELYSVHRVYWVDPQTGMLLSVSENEDLYLVSPASGSVITHLLRADLHPTPATVRRLASQDARGRDAIARLARARLALFALAGVLLLSAAGLLASGAGSALPRRLRPARAPGGQ